MYIYTYFYIYIYKYYIYLYIYIYIQCLREAEFTYGAMQPSGNPPAFEKVLPQGLLRR